MGHRLSRTRQRSRPRRHESLEDLSPCREFHHRLRSKGKHLHPANGVGKHQRLGRYQVVWSAAVLCTLSLEGPPLSQLKTRYRCSRRSRSVAVAQHFSPQPLFPTKAKNSSRVCLFSRNAPSIALVTACPCCFSTPRICMHKCRASIITPTPCGAILSSSARAIWLVMRS